MLAHAALTTHIKAQAKRLCNSVERWGKYALLSAALVTSAPQYGCSSTKTEQSQPQTYPDVSKTNSSGNVSFNINGSKYELTIKNLVTQQPLQDIMVILSKGENYAMYFAWDPKGEYLPNMIEAQSTMSINKTENGLEVGEYPQVIVPVYMPLLRNEDADRLAENVARLALEGIPLPQAVVGNTPADTDLELKRIGFEKVSAPEGVKLSQISNTLQNLIEFAVNQAAGTAIEHVIVFGIKFLKGVEVTNPIGQALLLGDITELLRTQEYADYYKQLCYEDDDLFSIYKFGGLDSLKFERDNWNYPLSLISNPIFIIVPDKKSDSWTPPTAKIAGQVDGEFPETTDVVQTPLWFVLQNHSEDAFRNVTLIGGNEFTAYANTCSNRDPSYDVAITTINVPSAETGSEYAKTSVSFKQTPTEQANQYDLTFVDPYRLDIANSHYFYTAYYEDKDRDGVGNEYKIKVYWKKPQGYVETPGDCNDEDPTIKKDCNIIDLVPDAMVDASIKDAGIDAASKDGEVDAERIDPCFGRYELQLECSKLETFENSDSVQPLTISGWWEGQGEFYVSFRPNSNGPVQIFGREFTNGIVTLIKMGEIDEVPLNATISLFGTVINENHAIPIIRYVSQNGLEYKSTRNQYEVRYVFEPAGLPSQEFDASQIRIKDVYLGGAGVRHAIATIPFDPQPEQVILFEEEIVDTTHMNIHIYGKNPLVGTYATRFIDAHYSNSTTYLVNESCITTEPEERCWHTPITPVYDMFSIVFAEGQMQNHFTGRPVTIYRSPVGESEIGTGLERSVVLADNVTSFVPGAYIKNQEEICVQKYEMLNGRLADPNYRLAYCIPGAKTIRQNIYEQLIIGVGPLDQDIITKLVRCNYPRNISR